MRHSSIRRAAGLITRENAGGRIFYVGFRVREFLGCASARAPLSLCLAVSQHIDTRPGPCPSGLSRRCCIEDFFGCRQWTDSRAKIAPRHIKASDGGSYRLQSICGPHSTMVDGSKAAARYSSAVGGKTNFQGSETVFCLIPEQICDTGVGLEDQP